MLDQYEREIDYLRISVTDRCNLRCAYCMPDGIRLIPMDQILTLEEMAEVAAAAARLGIRHVKLTGGEPLARKGTPSLVRILKQTQGIERVTLTTNGILLGKALPELLDAGLDAVNISLDTADRETYRRITGTDGLETVLQVVDKVCGLGLPTKINAVSLDLGDENLRALVELGRSRPLDVRFIEMMPIGQGKAFPVLDHRILLEKLRELWPGLEPDDTVHGFGPAVYYRIPGFEGSVGLISAIHGKFCSNCNRVRLTSQGYLKSCLCYHEGADLRVVLRSSLPEEQREEKLEELLRLAIWKKPREHCFENRREITEAAPMSAIGG